MEIKKKTSSLFPTRGFTRTLTGVSVSSRRERGFTLIETFVAITILLVALAGPLTLATKSLSAVLVAKDQLTASYLAQDAMEYVRYTRDTNILSGDNWLKDLDDCIAPKSCTIDAVEDKIRGCNGVCPPLRFDDGEGFYGHKGSWTLIPFTRTVRLIRITDDEYKVEVTVSWSTGVFSRSFVTQENIFEWVKIGP